MTDPRLIRRPMRFEREFTQLPNAWLRDEDLSYRARGLLSMLMSHESGFRVTLKGIADSSPREGLDAMREAVRELEAAGYLRRSRHRNTGRFEGDDWELCDPSAPVDGPVDSLLPTALDQPMRGADRVGSAHAYRVGSSNAYKNTEENTTRGGARARAASLGPRRDTPRQPCKVHRFLPGARNCEECGYCPSNGLFLDFLTGLYKAEPA